MNKSSVHDVPPTQPLADDLLTGAENIGKFIGKTTRQTYYLLENRKLRAFKLGAIWHARPTTLLAQITELEQPTEKTAA